MNHLESKKCVSTTPPTNLPERAKASCYDVISTLEHQLRTARALLGELTDRSSPVTQTSTSLVADYCAELRAEAVEVVKATAMLHDDVCAAEAAR